MGYMNIKKSETEEDRYAVDYLVDHTLGTAVVDEETAELLEIAKQAGASERSTEFRKLLELNW